MKKNELNLMRNSILALRSNESNSRIRFALICDRANGATAVTVAVVAIAIVTTKTEVVGTVAIFSAQCGRPVVTV